MRLDRTALAAARLLLAVAVAYAPAYRAGWVWDDRAHIVANENLRSADGLRRIWLEPRSLPQYYPLVHTTFWLEHQLWGTRPLGYHAVNVALHGIVAVLAFVLLRRLGVPGALLGAFIFALHPVHVESVAWVTERKNVLSGALYLSALLMLVRHFHLEAEAQRSEHDGASARAAWFLAVLLFVAALLSKTVTATLPAVVVLLLWWRGRPVGRRELTALAPLFVLGLGFGLNTARIEREHVGALGPEWDLSFAERMLIAGRAPWFYLGKLAWPSDLSFVYRRWVIDTADPWQYVPLLAGAAGLLGLYLLRRRIGRGPFAAAAFFVGTLLPALGFFNVYPMRFSFVADHFQYLASLGPIALLAAGLTGVCRHRAPLARRAGLVAAVVVPIGLGAMTLARARHYRDAVTLWRDTLTRNPECWLCLNNLGAEITREGRPLVSQPLLAEAVRLKPDCTDARVNLGVALAMTGRLEEAVRQYDVVLEGEANLPVPLYNRGLALARLDRLPEAVASFRAAAVLVPNDAVVQSDLGRALALLGRFGEAVEPLRRGLAAHPADAECRRELAFVLNATGCHAEALVYARESLALDPNSLGAWLELARTLSALGEHAGLRQATDEILRRAPGHAEARALRDGRAHREP